LTNSFIQEDDKIVLVGFTPRYYIYDYSPIGLLEGNMSVILSRYTIKGISEEGDVGLNQETKNDFSIYPNPTNSILNIQSDKVIQKISVFNYLGELVIQENGQALNQINVEQLNKGIYVIRMIGKDGNVFNGKFVKE
ncbi:MAG: T9SS type A sorting domain-containing protein, partial [Brumimicrobium sp.]